MKESQPEYRPRIADRLLQEKLEETGAVLIEGLKWCGKTTTGSQYAASIIYLDDPALSAQYKQTFQLQPDLLLKGDYPRLFDEWQTMPQIWDAVRHFVDRANREGMFILTGSAVPPSYDHIQHSGAGRYSWLTMSTMTLSETGDSSGEISLAKLFAGLIQSGTNKLGLEKIAFLICRGGWPAAIGKAERPALRLAVNYLDAVVRWDLNRVDGVTRNPDLAREILRVYARAQGSQTSDTSLLKDLTASDPSRLSISTLKSYISAFEKIFMINDAKAWNPNLRSKTAVRTSPTRYFNDSSIAAAALGIGPSDLVNDLETMGLFFETLAIHDLRVYAQALDGEVYHYRDKTGLECDMVIHLRNGRYGLIEVKLGGETAIEYGVANLMKLKERIDTDKMPEPSFLMVLTAVGPFAYQRPDGVWVVPIGCLKD